MSRAQEASRGGRRAEGDGSGVGQANRADRRGDRNGALAELHEADATKTGAAIWAALEVRTRAKRIHAMFAGVPSPIYDVAISTGGTAPFSSRTVGFRETCSRRSPKASLTSCRAAGVFIRRARPGSSCDGIRDRKLRVPS